MKQVVIKGSENYTTLLTPKWTKEYFRRKGKEVYIYRSEHMLDPYDDYIRVFKLNDKDNDFKEMYYFYISKENDDKVINEKQAERLREDNKLTNSYDLFNNREDEILIQIAKEINNEDIIKVVKIPDNVEYEITSIGTGFRESIIEKHRIWE